MPEVVSLYSPNHWDYFDSYGLIACQLARHLTALGVRVNALGLGEMVRDNQPDSVREVTARPILPSLGGLFLGYPTAIVKQDNPLAQMGPRVAVTMFESSRLPDDWVEPLNGCDAVITPSTFCRDVFVSSGVTAPVHVIPLGIDEAYTLREEPVNRRDGKPLTFLAFMDRGLRKGGVYAMQAFLRAFGDSPDHRLILKSREAQVGVNMVNPNIEMIQHDMTAEELNQLYHQADVLVNPNMGEGFGLIPREFAATGGIALATNWSGTADDIELWGWPLPYALAKATWPGNTILEGRELGVWAKPDVVGVAKAMQDVADNLSAYAFDAYVRAQEVRRMYDWRLFAERVLEVWREVSVDHRIAA